MFTLVSWNIQYGKGVDGRIDLGRIAETVHKDGLPDVLCLQEVSRNYPERPGIGLGRGSIHKGAPCRARLCLFLFSQTSK